MTSNVSEVKSLLKLFGELPEATTTTTTTPRIEELSKKKPNLFQKLLSLSDLFYEPNPHRKTGRLFIIMEGGKVMPLVHFEKLVVVNQVGKKLTSLVNTLSVTHNITGRPEYKLFQLIGKGLMETLTDGVENGENPVSFARCVFMNDEKSEALHFARNGMEQILTQFGIRTMICNEWKFPKNDGSSAAKKLAILEEKIRSTLTLIQDFLSSSGQDISLDSIQSSSGPNKVVEKSEKSEKNDKKGKKKDKKKDKKDKKKKKDKKGKKHEKKEGPKKSKKPAPVINVPEKVEEIIIENATPILPSTETIVEKSVKKDKKGKKGEEKPAIVINSIPDIIQPFLPDNTTPVNAQEKGEEMIIENATPIKEPEFLIINRTMTDYNTGLEWFLKSPSEMKELLCI